MSMKALEDLRETLCKELDEIARKPEMSAGDLEAVHKLTDTVKNIDKISMLEEGGYSGAGEWEADMRGTFGRGGNSYANRGKHYVRGHYSRDDGASYRGGRGRYSRDDGYSQAGSKEEKLSFLEMMMEEASTDRERQAIRRCIEQIENG